MHIFIFKILYAFHTFSKNIKSLNYLHSVTDDSLSVSDVLKNKVLNYYNLKIMKREGALKQNGRIYSSFLILKQKCYLLSYN